VPIKELWKKLPPQLVPLDIWKFSIDLLSLPTQPSKEMAEGKAAEGKFTRNELAVKTIHEW